MMEKIRFVDFTQHQAYQEWLNDELGKLHMSEYSRIVNSLEHVSKESIAENLYNVPIHFIQVQKDVEEEQQTEEYLKSLKSSGPDAVREHMQRVLSGGGLNNSSQDDDDDDDDEDLDGFDLLN